MWKTAEKAPDASEALKLSAHNLHQLGLIDEVVDEGQGGHIESDVVMTNLKNLLNKQLNELEMLGKNELLSGRYDRLMRFNSTIAL